MSDFDEFVRLYTEIRERFAPHLAPDDWALLPVLVMINQERGDLRLAPRDDETAVTCIRMDYADYHVDVDLGDLAHPVRVGAAGMLFPRCTALPIEKVPPAALRRAAAIAEGADCHDACRDLLHMYNRSIAQSPLS